MPERRRRFDSEFKLEALRLADDPGRSDASVERDLGLFGGAYQGLAQATQESR
jgi:transposase-like protein